MSNKKYLTKIGIINAELQANAIANLPCGIELVKDVMRDETPWQTNAPRVLEICHFKGRIAGLIAAQNLL